MGLCGTCKSSICTCKSSCCQESVPACPQPFYSQSSVCLEDHTDTVCQPLVIASVKVENAFNMPACGQSAELKLQNVSELAVGAYLWKASVGYLQVIAFNGVTGIATVQNNCNVGNVAVGTTIPGCAQFVVTDPPATPQSQSPTGIFVAIDFTAPNVGNCILITVTGVNGLAVNKNVQIGSGTYRIDSIPDGTHIVICNDGAGITPGTAVIAKDGAGNYQYPLVLIDTNPCTNTAVSQGAVLVCKDGISQPLDGTQAGQVLVLLDPETNEAEYQFLDVPTRTCATITCCLTIVTGFAGPYIIPVSDSSQFQVGDFLQIGTRSDRVIVDVIIDGTTIQGTITPVPTSTTDIAPGTSICLIDCCEDLQGQVNDLQNQINAIPCAPLEMWLFNQVVGVSDATPGTVDSGTPVITNANSDAMISVTNASTCRNAVLTLYVESKFVGNSTGEFSGVFRITETVDVNPAVILEDVGRSFDGAIGNGINDVNINRVRTFVLTPGQTLTYFLSQAVLYLAGAGSHTVTTWENRITAVGLT